MAFHAIRAGEGDAFVAAGVESISQVDGYPQGRRGAPSEAASATTRRSRTSTSRWGVTAENVAEQLGRLARGHGPLRASARRSAPSPRRTPASSRARSRPGTASRQDDGPRRESTLEKLASLEPAFKPGRQGDRRQLVPAERRRRGGVVMSEARARELGDRAACADRRLVACRASAPEIMGVGPIEAVRRVLAPGRDDHRRRRRRRAERGLRRAGASRSAASSASTRSASS